MTKDSVYKTPQDKEFIKHAKPRDSVTKPIHQYTWPQDRTYEVVYEVIIDGSTSATMTETIKANSYAHAAWRLARILPFSPTQAYNLLDVIRLS
jgi:hypothetical protein